VESTVVETLRAALRTHKVLVLRAQHLTPDQHVATVSLFGEPFDHPTALRHPDNPLVYPYRVEQSGKASQWHVGGVWRIPAFRYESLVYDEVAKLGGDTLWADLQARTRICPGRCKCSSSRSARCTTATKPTTRRAARRVSSGGPSYTRSCEPTLTPTAKRSHTYRIAVARLLNALAGRPLADDGTRLYPGGTRLLTDIWQATFSSNGGARIGATGSGLLLSRHQPRPCEAPGATLAQLQEPIIDAYTDALPSGVQPRVGVSRSVVVGRDSTGLRALAEAAAPRLAAQLRKAGHPSFVGDPSHGAQSTEALLAALDIHIGTPEQVLDSLGADPIVARATDLIMQVHPIDPGQKATLGSLELIATEIAPALGWQPNPAAPGGRPTALQLSGMLRRSGNTEWPDPIGHLPGQPRA
jgi:hypothetical protein